jgi:hypothetical protein
MVDRSLGKWLNNKGADFFSKIKASISHKTFWQGLIEIIQ